MKSLKVLKAILAIGWWGTIAATLLVAVVGTIVVYDPDSINSIDLYGYAGSLDTSALSAVTQEGLPAIVEFREPVRLKITIPPEYWESRRGIVAIGVFAMVAILGLFLYLLHLLRQIVWSVEDGNPFIPDNAKRLRIIGALMIVGGFSKTVSEFAMSGYADTVLRPGGFSLDGHLGLDFTTLIVGLSVIVLSEVFRVGAAIREEQKLTI